VSEKLCKHCFHILHSTEFHRNARMKDGLNSICKKCNKSNAAAWYKANQARGKEVRRRYYTDNHAKCRTMQKDYRCANGSKVKAVEKKWREQNKERKRSNDKAWQVKYPERVKVFRRVSEHRRRCAINASEEHHTAKDVERLMALQKRRCVCCEVSLKDGYHIDHIQPLRRGGHNGVKNIQLLCPNCNTRKNAKDPITFMQENGFLL
jgi:5-methylcytosine-specific restriction endonuclease McrA